ncbi:MAG: ribonuclease HI [Proteobacteria bacterium]|nr:ribonuclease HI [Pseudomonadota bacterium]
MPENDSDWKRLCFKNNKVWALVDKSGNYILKEGKVLIKYQKNQSHEYLVFETALKPENHPDCAAGNAAKKAGPKAVPPKPSSASAPTEKKFPDNTIIVYTDGASSGNPGPAGIGVLLKYGEHQKEISRYIGIGTNNIAELEAIRTALTEIRKKNLPVRIFTDSSYAIGVLTKSWKAKANQELIGSIKHLMDEFKDIRLIKVEGHAGIEENERADVLATSAIKARY